MVRSKRLLLGLIPAVVAAGAAVALGAPGASGAPAVVGTGTVACTGASGTIKFDPSVTLIGGQLTATLKVVLHGCTAGGGSNVSTSGFKGKGQGTVSVEGGTNCASLIGGSPPFRLVGTIEVRWTAKVDRKPGKAPYQVDPSTLVVGQMTSVGAGSNGNVGLTFARQQLSGSFSSSASTLSGELDSTKAPSRVVCGGSRVVKKLNIDSGGVSQP